MTEAFALQKLLTFFQQKYWHVRDIIVWNFNETLTNGVVSFEQPDPDEVWLHILFNKMENKKVWQNSKCTACMHETENDKCDQTSKFSFTWLEKLVQHIHLFPVNFARIDVNFQTVIVT